MKSLKSLLKSSCSLIPILFFVAAGWADNDVSSSRLFDDFSVGFEKTVLPEPIPEIVNKSKNGRITEIPAFAFSRTTPD
ncbi:MAG: hypothetical protein KAI33_07095, partial [Elusimicrobiales bacterium]|nr:hypothetical protein [Elusimicrobiales bacterium]